MELYRLEKSEAGWLLRKKRSVRPIFAGLDRAEAIAHAKVLLTGRDVSLRILGDNGSFVDLRL